MSFSYITETTEAPTTTTTGIFRIKVVSWIFRQQIRDLQLLYCYYHIQFLFQPCPNANGSTTDIIPMEIVDHKMASNPLKNVVNWLSREMRPLLVTSFDSLGMEIGKLIIHIIIYFNFGILMSSIIWLINWYVFFLIVAHSNAEENKITVAGAGGAQLKIFPRVLANKQG